MVLASFGRILAFGGLPSEEYKSPVASVSAVATCHPININDHIHVWQ